MAISGRFRHELVIHSHVAGSEADDVDIRGDRTDSWEPGDPIAGLVQARSSREIRGSELDGLAVTNALAFLPVATVIAPADYVQLGDALYEVLGQARDAGGRGRHLEADLFLVVP